MTSKVAAIQMVSKGDIRTNLDAAGRLIASAAEQGAQLVLLPENFAVLDGGPLRQYAEVQGAKDSLMQAFLAQQSKTHGITLVGGTIPLLSRPAIADQNPELITDGRVRPACLVYGPMGTQLARYDKMHLFDVMVGDKQAQYSESRSFEAGNEVVTMVSPLGRLGLSVCYDLRFPEIYRQLFAEGALIVTVPSAFTFKTGQAHWEPLLRARAIENQCYIVAANQGGVHNEKRETWGHSMIVDPWGTILDCVDEGEGVAIAEIDLEALNTIRHNMPIAAHRRL